MHINYSIEYSDSKSIMIKSDRQLQWFLSNILVSLVSWPIYQTCPFIWERTESIPENATFVRDNAQKKRNITKLN